MVKRRIAWEFYVVSLAITLFILFMGIYVGIFLSRGKIEELREELINLKLKQEELILELTMFGLNKNMSCNVLTQAVERDINEAGKLGDRVSLYETTEKFKDESFYSLKKDYTLTLVRYWLHLEEIKKNCDKSNLVTVLYFYSNQNCFDCLPQGTILTYMKQKYPQNLMVFALDYDLDLSIISAIKRIYGVEKVPSLVVNGERYEGLVTLEKLSQILCTKYKLC
jgi:hypothetical protein